MQLMFTTKEPFLSLKSIKYKILCLENLKTTSVHPVKKKFI